MAAAGSGSRSSSRAGDEISELTSWKEIAGYLGVSTRTAQRYERELQLPVRRLTGEKGRGVAARISDLSAWQERNKVGPRWWRRPYVLQVYSLIVTLIALVTGYAVIQDLRYSISLGKPARSYWVGSVLVVTDSSGRELWRRTFPHGANEVNVPYHGDLDGDSRIETVVPYLPQDGVARDILALIWFASRKKETSFGG